MSDPAGAVRFVVRLTPRAGTDRIDGISDDGLLVARVRAAPVDGAANTALVGLLADTLRVPRSTVVVEHGLTARRKRIRVEGVTVETLRAAWPGLVASAVS